MSREYLNIEQKEALARLHPDANKTGFMDRISKITITSETENWILKAFDKYDIHPKLLLKDK